jgi:CheY-like chemotaxis protein
METKMQALVVHDDPDVLKLLVRIIEKCGKETLKAECLDDALFYAAQHQNIDLFVIDGSFPKKLHCEKKQFDNSLHFLDAIALSHPDAIKVAHTMAEPAFVKKMKDKGCQHVCRVGEAVRLIPSIIATQNANRL